MKVVWEIFIGCVAIQSLYYLVVFARLNFIRGFKSLPEFFPPVSIIICARNEAENLLQNLKVVLIQQYKQFEVIVVNDQSEDNTIDVLVDYYKRNQNMKLVDIDKNEQKPYAGKKYALLKALDVASFDTIVVTDADCRPATTHWLSKLVACYVRDTKIVLGHSPYEKGEGFLNKLIRYENFITALQCFGFAVSGIPYMGVGRNLSYKKDLFKSFSGFGKNKTMLTGDDDLLINEMANKHNTEICIDKDAFMYSKAETTWQAWLNQKKRHLRSGFKYKFVHQVLLFLFAASVFLVYPLSMALLIKLFMLKWLLVAFAVLILLRLVVTFRIAKKLGVEDLRFFFPILDAAYALYLLIIFVLLLAKPKDTWKR